MTNPIVERLLRLMDYRSGEIRAGAAAEIRKIFSTKDAEIERLSAELERARETISDLISWFPEKPSEPEWRLKAGQYGTDDAVSAARKFMEETDDRT